MNVSICLKKGLRVGVWKWNEWIWLFSNFAKRGIMFTDLNERVP